MSTLGQIAFIGAMGEDAFWEVTDQAKWEAAAKAVRAAVIEECATLVEGFRDEHSKAVAYALRSLK
jgi:hypothetical protein